MNRALRFNPAVPSGQFFEQPDKVGAAPADIQLDPGTPQTPMGKAEATTNADGPAQLQPGGPWVGDTWCNVLEIDENGSRAIRIDEKMPKPEARRDDPNLFHYADRQWHVRRRVFTDNLLLLLDRDVVQDPDSFTDSSVDVAGHWVGLYKATEKSFEALTQEDASYVVRAFDQQVTNEAAALDITKAEELARMAETRLQTILTSGAGAAAEIRSTRTYTDITVKNQRISVEYRNPVDDRDGISRVLAEALGLLPDPFLWLIDSIYYHAEMPNGPVANRPGGVSATAPEDLFDKRYVDLRAVKGATPGAMARNLLNVSARAFLTHEIVLVPEAGGWQIVLNKPLDRDRWQRPSDFVSDLDSAWILAHRADQRHPQLIRHLNRVYWPLADGVAQDLAMFIGDDGNVNSTWVAQNPHLALLYSAWLSKVDTQGLMLPGEVTGPLERAAWLFLQKKHSEA